MGPVLHRVDSCTGSVPRPFEQAILPRVDIIMYGTDEVLLEPSRETKFLSVHKDNCAARDLGAGTRASPSRTVL